MRMVPVTLVQPQRAQRGWQQSQRRGGQCSDDPSTTAWCPLTLQDLTPHPRALFPRHKTVKGSEPALPRTPVKSPSGIFLSWTLPRAQHSCDNATEVPAHAGPAAGPAPVFWVPPGPEHTGPAWDTMAGPQSSAGVQWHEVTGTNGSAGSGLCDSNSGLLPRGAHFTHLQPITGTHTHRSPPPPRHCAQG